MKVIKKSSNNITPYSPMRSIFDDFFAVPSVFDEVFSSARDLSVDIWEEDDNFFVKMAMPGVSKESINISTSADTVTIRGGSKEETKKEDKRKFYCKTLESSFEQTFNLPARVDSSKAEANFENGVLTLKLPKAEDLKPKQIAVK